MRRGFARKPERALRRADASRRIAPPSRRAPGRPSSSIPNGRPGPNAAGRNTTGRGTIGNPAQFREARKSGGADVYRRRRVTALGSLALGALALVFVVFVGTRAPDAAEGAAPINPSKAAPDTMLAEAPGEIEISTPIRPASLTALGYHSEDEGVFELAPRGENLSVSPFLGLFAGGEVPEGIRYHVMDPAGREGPRTGALDVGAGAGAKVYAPVSGVVTAIRPDPTLRDANVVEIKPAANPDARVAVSLVHGGDDAGVNTPVVAGMTGIGTVADSAEVLDPQLSSYAADEGNHVTVSVSQAG